MSLLSTTFVRRSLGRLPITTVTSNIQRRSVARMTIVGRLGAEPEIQPTSTGQDVIKYAVGTSYGPRDARQTSWFKVSSFEKEGPRRDLLLGLQKGTLVYIEGEARMRTFEDKEGSLRSALNITQRNLEILKRPDQAKTELAEGAEGQI